MYYCFPIAISLIYCKLLVTVGIFQCRGEEQVVTIKHYGGVLLIFSGSVIICYRNEPFGGFSVFFASGISHSISAHLKYRVLRLVPGYLGQR
jgi:hypothetical protein